MSDDRKTTRLVVILLTLGALGVVLSLPLLGFATLGFLGILADVSTPENHKMGLGFLTLGLPALVAGLVFCLLAGLVVRRSRHRLDRTRRTSDDDESMAGKLSS
jgi:uncharacterized BrkB/YihY/UPF0761 family membrane protein